MSKKLTALAVCLFFSIAGAVSAQRLGLASTLPRDRTRLTEQRNSEEGRESSRTRAKANLRVSKAVYLPQVGLTSESINAKKMATSMQQRLPHARPGEYAPGTIRGNPGKGLTLHRKRSVAQRLNMQRAKKQIGSRCSQSLAQYYPHTRRDPTTPCH